MKPLIWCCLFTLLGGCALAAESAEFEDLKRKAEEGDANAQLLLGKQYFIRAEGIEGAKWYRRAAEQGNADAQNMLGVIYGDGRGVKRDKAESLKWFLRAAAQGHVIAQENLGMIYMEGEGVPRDFVESFAWFSIAGDSASYPVKKWLQQLRAKMTSEQIAEATKLARERVDKFRKKE